jgi:peptidoglycan/xylan/chitin deacetylase (PgdA/CDA1 family)
MRPVIITYHAVDTGRSPLCLAPSIFREHLDCIVDHGWKTATVAQLADALRTGSLPDRSIVLSFDDGFASVADTATPELVARGMVATVFCVAGHLGGVNDWLTDRPGGYRSALATPHALRELAAAGIEIGAHGHAHAPLVATAAGLLRRELIDARSSLEQAVGTSVASLAYPYGAPPSTPAASIVRRTYRAACGTALRRVGTDDDVFDLPRIDAHYLRRLDLLERLLEGRLDGYLVLRRLAARARRAVRKDYLPSARPK